MAYIDEGEGSHRFRAGNPTSSDLWRNVMPACREFCRTWRNQTEVTLEGIHFVQEDGPEQIDRALAAFVRSLRSL